MALLKSRPLVLLATTIFLCLAACSGSGSDSGGDILTVESPAAGATMRAGEMMMLEVSTKDFSLGRPPNIAENASGFVGQLGREIFIGHGDEDHHLEVAEAETVETAHGEDMHGEDMHDAATHVVEEATHDDEHADDGHSHDATQTNPFARQGHMHIYLDGGAGSESHITSWSYSTPIELPADLSAGMHSLRIELRDDNHVIVDPLTDQFLFFEVRE